jgi:hypothetical protein
MDFFLFIALPTTVSREEALQVAREWPIANAIDYRMWSFGRVGTVQVLGPRIRGPCHGSSDTIREIR